MTAVRAVPHSPESWCFAARRAMRYARAIRPRARPASLRARPIRDASPARCIKASALRSRLPILRGTSAQAGTNRLAATALRAPA